MTITLAEVLDLADLEKHIDAGYVKATRHPTAPLTIYNYTNRAQFDRVWNDTTRTCRGLIVHDDDTIVARPFRKFFNHGEVDEIPGGPVRVLDKLDGSMGVLYHDGDGWAIATRGSFTSEQAIHATEVLRTRYADFEPLPGWTYLFEIIYPENRIVIDYEGLDDLVLLDVIHTASGRTVWFRDATSWWHGPVVESLPYDSLAEALVAPPRPGREGMVVHFIDSDERLKIKQEDYVRLHRLMFGVSARSVYEVLRSGDTGLDDLLDRVPDEFYAWVTATRAELVAARDAAVAAGQALHDHAATELAARGLDPTDPSYPKEFALLLNPIDDPAKHIAFAIRSGKPYDAWRLVEPSGTRRFATQNEDSN